MSNNILPHEGAPTHLTQCAPAHKGSLESSLGVCQSDNKNNSNNKYVKTFQKYCIRTVGQTDQIKNIMSVARSNMKAEVTEGV